MDVVKLIRKAKISDDNNREPTDLARNEDFISLDGGFDDFLPDAPRGPKADTLDHLGKRKRDEDGARPRQPGGYPPSHRAAPVLREWQAPEHVNSAPWLSQSSRSGPAAIA